MQNRSCAVLGLAFLICGISTGCHIEYQATLLCVGCTGSSEVTGDWSCSPEAATASAASKCFINDVPGNPRYEERLVFNLGGCAEDPVGSLLPEAGRDIVRQAGLRIGKTAAPQTVELAEGPTCPPSKVDLKVTVFQDVPVPECPGDIKVEVSYFQEIAEGEYDYVTLSATIGVGGKHEFVCTDAGTTEFGFVGTIRVAVLTDLNCGGNPDALAHARAFSQIPADGSSLVCHSNLDTNTLDAQIIPPAAPTATAQETDPLALRRALIPIPDPRFTQTGR